METTFGALRLIIGGGYDQDQHPLGCIRGTPKP